MSEVTLVWFRQDLRLRDNPALTAAAARGAVVPIYIWSPEEEGGWAPGAAARWWLHRSLEALDRELRQRGSRLVLARGPALPVLEGLAAATGARAAFWNKRYEPAAIACSERVRSALAARGIESGEFGATLLREPANFLNRSGRPYQVYTAFQRALLQGLQPALPLQAPRDLKAPRRWPVAASLPSLGLLPQTQWYSRMESCWQPGEAGARAGLRRFVRDGMADYSRVRDFPAADGTSRLSPHLHFGELGPRQVWHVPGPLGQRSKFLAELLWREFAYHLLYHFPHTVDQPMRPQFRAFPWRNRPALLRAWQHGKTGIPLVDAGMRQLWATGWMHNRVRMVAGSFLVKNLLIPWQSGARWFWNTLVDADLANNTLNWQWVAGSGADAAPYFRVFNPLEQARRFDPDGAYLDRWAPEHSGPAGREGGAIVDVAKTRVAALAAYAAMQRVTSKS